MAVNGAGGRAMASAGRGGSKAPPPSETKTLGDLSFEEQMDLTLDEIPEESDVPPGEYRLRVISAKNATSKDGSTAEVMFALRPIEALDGDPGVDLNACRPLFQRFRRNRSMDLQQLKEIAVGAGLDTSMKLTELVEGGAFDGLELEGIVVHKPSRDDPSRPFVNVNGLRVAEG